MTKPTPTRVHVAGALKAAGTAGMLSPDIAVAVGVSDAALWEVLWRMNRKRELAWWPDPHGKAGNRRRYWLPEFKPEKQPAPSGPSLKDRRAAPVRAEPFRRDDGVLELPHQPVYSRHQLARLPPGHQSVLNPADCRDWARAARPLHGASA